MHYILNGIYIYTFSIVIHYTISIKQFTIMMATKDYEQQLAFNKAFNNDSSGNRQTYGKADVNRFCGSEF